MPRKPNGRILTVKQLSARAYAAVHDLPRGFRGPAMHLLLDGLADFAAKNRKWYVDVKAGNRCFAVSLRKTRRAAKTVR